MGEGHRCCSIDATDTIHWAENLRVSLVQPRNSINAPWHKGNIRAVGRDMREAGPFSVFYIYYSYYYYYYLFLIDYIYVNIYLFLQTFSQMKPIHARAVRAKPIPVFIAHFPNIPPLALHSLVDQTWWELSRIFFSAGYWIPRIHKNEEEKNPQKSKKNPKKNTKTWDMLIFLELTGPMGFQSEPRPSPYASGLPWTWAQVSGNGELVERQKLGQNSFGKKPAGQYQSKIINAAVKELQHMTNKWKAMVRKKLVWAASWALGTDIKS